MFKQTAINETASFVNLNLTPTMGIFYLLSLAVFAYIKLVRYLF